MTILCNAVGKAFSVKRLTNADHDKTVVERTEPGYKRVFDLFIVLTVLTLLVPVVFAVVVLLSTTIWMTDRGPVFYRSLRIGRNGKPFHIVKFRTMVPGSDSLGPAWTTKDDVRITNVGRLLRKTGLDELPGVLSIIRGDMSLVGPRPLTFDETQVLQQELPSFSRRLACRPGLTGLAQLYALDGEPRHRLKLDLLYTRKRSLWLDIKILTASVWFTVTGRWDKRSITGITGPERGDENIER